jgi:hypothetical protein
MPPAVKVSRHAMFRAKIKGIMNSWSNTAKFMLTGEKVIAVIVGCPRVICHHGTNTETAINTKVEMPATIAM